MYPAPEIVAERIRSRVVKNEEGCWIWPGATSVGYGRIAWTASDGRKLWGGVHRVMYADRFGAIGEGLDIDHQCHDPAKCKPAVAIECPHRRCCNPDHLVAMTRRENLRRGGTMPAMRAAITECPQGHLYSAENTKKDKLGRRICRECTAARNRAYYWRNREARSAYNKAWHAKRKEQDQ